MAQLNPGTFGGRETRGRPLIFGEVLFDRFPDGREVLGGAPFNVAWNLRGFGEDPLLVSRVGQDDLGDRILTAMAEWGLDDTGVQRDTEHATGTVDVSLSGGEPSFDILDGRAYDFIQLESAAPLPTATLLYHGSLAARGSVSRAALERLREECGAPVFVDVNLRAPWWNAEGAHALLRGAAVIKINDNELRALIDEGMELDDAAQRLRERTGCPTVCVTRGAAGAFALDRGERCEVDATVIERRMDTVGAGDAFAAVLMLGQLRGWRMETSMRRARDFAGAVVGLRGATVNDPEFYRPYCEAWSDA